MTRTLLLQVFLLTLTCCVASAQTTSEGAEMGTPVTITEVTPPGGGTGYSSTSANPENKPMDQPPAFPPGDRNAFFSYQPSVRHEELTVVHVNSTGESMHVPTAYLNAILLNYEGNPQQMLAELLRYPQVLANNRWLAELDMFPDSSTAIPGPEPELKETTLQGTSKKLHIAPDEKAPPYARLKLSNLDGSDPQEFSINLRIAVNILENTSMNADEKIAELTKPVMRLPEQAREKFSDITTTDIVRLAESNPGFQDLEPVKTQMLLAQANEELKSTPLQPPTAHPQPRKPGNLAPSDVPLRQPGRGDHSVAEQESLNRKTNSLTLGSRASLLAPFLVIGVLATAALAAFYYSQRRRK